MAVQRHYCSKRIYSPLFSKPMCRNGCDNARRKPGPRGRQPCPPRAVLVSRDRAAHRTSPLVHAVDCTRASTPCHPGVYLVSGPHEIYYTCVAHTSCHPRRARIGRASFDKACCCAAIMRVHDPHMLGGSLDVIPPSIIAGCVPDI